MAKTVELITRNYWFPRIRAFVKDYIDSCYLCQQGKAPRHAKHGELAPLPVPASPWKGLTCDFIVDLPTSNGYDSILVFVDCLIKMTHFIPCRKTTTTPEFAKLFIAYIVKLHGLPASIVSDRGSIFTSKFWSTLSRLLKIDARRSTAYHPQTDGQTERLNQILEQYLRIYCNHQQDNWHDLLPLAEFAYNNAHQSTIQTSPFYANYGYHPHFHVEFLPETPNAPAAPAAENLASRLQNLHEQLVENVTAAQNYQATFYDTKHTPSEFKPGDRVWLDARNLPTSRPSKKLDWKRLGPFEIAKRIGTQAYQLKLPATMRIHPTFHVSLLDPYRESLIPDRVQRPPPPARIGAHEYFEVEAILDSKLIRRRLFYLIKWQGYPDSENSWESATNVSAPDLIRQFHEAYPTKPGKPLPRRRVHFIAIVP